MAAAAIGNAMEWYDYGVFTSGAITTSIGHHFFPGSSGASMSFVLVAVSFIVRPFGGSVFGPIGDKIGRQKVLAMTVILMAGGTFLVGALPVYAGTYSFGLGATALIVLLRLTQGFSTGGEYGGAATLMAEYAPTKRRGFYGSFLAFGTLSGYVFGNLMVLMVTLVLGRHSAAFDAWGWRIPFLIALPLGGIGLYLRLRLEDTPTFKALAAAGEAAKKAPLRETLSHHWPMMTKLVGIVVLLNIADYTVLTTMPTYFITELHVSTTTSTAIIIGVELLMMSVVWMVGSLSDRVGRKPLMTAMAVGYLVLSYPAFLLMHTHSFAGLLIGFIILALLLVLMLGVIDATFPAMFPTRVRYGAFAISYNVSTSAFGGTAGLVILTVIHISGNTYVPAFYLMLAAVIGLIPILLIPETVGVPMSKIGATSAPRRDEAGTGRGAS